MKAASPAAGGIGQRTAASLVNSFRLAAVAQRLAFFVQAGRLSNYKDLGEFRTCCITLAKGIDFAIANNEIPSKARELPFLLKKLCRRRSEHYSIYAVLMVMMLSVKNACQLGWFQQSDSQELLALADEIWNGFGSHGGSSPSLEGSGTPFSLIMERFYPFMKLGLTLLSLEVKSGYTILAKDFCISKKMPHTTQQKILLFVARTDSIETSACIINPPEVSFLLNGKPVVKRVNFQMDPGPQLPTNVTPLLKYGTNLLQAMGNFNGHYIIVLAFVDVILLPETSVLKDYVQSESIESNSDADLIEGPSRISLSCPISHSRIKLPVKGHLCKHLQCFDFSNYVNINMRKPSWRCPHCNQPVCYTDIRVDQNMVKVLKEVGDNAADVIISTGGSWKVAVENDETMEPVRETNHDHEDQTSILNSGQMVLDLTGDDDEMGTFGNTEVEDQKPLLSDIQGQSSNANNAALNGDFSGFHTSNDLPLDSIMLDQFSAPSNGMPQPAQTSEAALGQEYIDSSPIPRSRDPVAVQALPIPSLQTSSTTEGRPAATTTTFNASIPISQSPQFQASPVMPAGHYMASASQVQTSSTQDRPVTTTMVSPPIQRPQSSQAHAPFVMPVGHCQGSTARLMERWRLYYRNPSQVPASTSSHGHPSILNMRSQFTTPLRQPPSSHESRAANINFGHQTRFVSNDQINSLNQAGPTVQPVSQVSNLVDQTSANNTTPANWRPVGRMRGSLVPGSYSASLDHMIIRPSQQQSRTTRSAQTCQPLPSMDSYNLPDIQALLANQTPGMGIPQTQTVIDSPPVTVLPPDFTEYSGTMPPPGTWWDDIFS
ncbi:PREDICTED: E4 SUMO-protein ligase PIAL2 [Tarenaya hassleriana]|uniref:E4 SUMO-protein ligase PIAL2 n=1 Tax=Tarenaya hassleriana TaxID=28532 RepID=UPI00053C3EB4|nr:PREDICTED: E4 SUMO-protein ligase PIAL2 [Tarenaya hassleriana]